MTTTIYTFVNLVYGSNLYISGNRHVDQMFTQKHLIKTNYKSHDWLKGDVEQSSKDTTVVCFQGKVRQQTAEQTYQTYTQYDFENSLEMNCNATITN